MISSPKQTTSETLTSHPPNLKSWALKSVLKLLKNNSACKSLIICYVYFAPCVFYIHLQQVNGPCLCLILGYPYLFVVVSLFHVVKYELYFYELVSKPPQCKRK